MDPRREGISSIAARVSILAGGALWVWMAVVTTRSSEGDFFDASIFKWGSVVIPMIAFLGAFAGIERSPIAWGIAFVLPAVIWTFLAGTVLFDPDQGASFWVVGEVFLAILGAFTAAGAAIGGVVRQAVDRKRRGDQPCPSCGSLVVGADRFCRTCGAQLQANGD